VTFISWNIKHLQNGLHGQFLSSFRFFVLTAGSTSQLFGITKQADSNQHPLSWQTSNAQRKIPMTSIWENAMFVIVFIVLVQMLFVMIGIDNKLRELVRRGDGSWLDRVAHILRHEFEQHERREASGEAEEHIALRRKLDDYADMGDGIIAAIERREAKERDE
jgi:hypothetical protein